MNLKALKSFVAKAIEEAKEKTYCFGALESNNDENFRSIILVLSSRFCSRIRKIQHFYLVT
jgi:hypothetical protein